MSVVGIVAPRAPKQTPAHVNASANWRDCAIVAAQLLNGNANWNQRFQKFIEAIELVVIYHIADSVQTKNKTISEALKSVKRTVGYWLGKSPAPQPSKYGVKTCGFYTETIFTTKEERTELCSDDPSWAHRIFNEFEDRSLDDMDLSDALFQGKPSEPIHHIMAIHMDDDGKVIQRLDIGRDDIRFTPKNLIRLAFGCEPVKKERYITSQTWFKDHPKEEKPRREVSREPTEEVEEEVIEKDDIYDHLDEDTSPEAQADIEARARNALSGSE